MTPNEFIVWLEGFMSACNEHTATPKQWDLIKDMLKTVQKEIVIKDLTPILPTTPYIPPYQQYPYPPTITPPWGPTVVSTPDTSGNGSISVASGHHNTTALTTDLTPRTKGYHCIINDTSLYSGDNSNVQTIAN